MATHREAAALSADGAPRSESQRSGSSHWIEAHEALSRLARERAALDAEEGRWLLRALRAAVHVHLGFGSFCQYIERLFGYKSRTTQEKLRVAESLEGLPQLADALASGALGWCAARELTRVAVPETEQTWLDAARGKTQRELEALVADKSPGDAPDAPGTGAPRRHVLRFEVAADTFATFREAMQHLERTAGSRLDHDALLLALARHALGGPTSDGRSSYQISLHVCSICSRGEQVAAGELVPVDDAVVEMAACDAQHLGQTLAPAVPQRAANENANTPDHGSRHPAGPGERKVHEHDGVSDDTAGRCSDRAHVGAAVHHVDVTTATRGTNEVASRHAATATPPMPGAAPRTPKHPLPRARQTIPPALRRAVLDRDHHRCQVPGCTHTTYVDVHHIHRRADGGLNEIWNLTTLCSVHHRATHHGQLLIERSPEGSLVFRHADGRLYGDPSSPQRIEVHTKIFSALRHLGFRESEVKSVLAELRTDPTLANAPAERLLREALCRIKPRAR